VVCLRFDTLLGVKLCGQWARLDWRRAGLDPQGATLLDRLGITGELNEIEVVGCCG
jgi:hypothetical protein